MSEQPTPPPSAERRNRAVFFIWAALLPFTLMVLGVAFAHFEIIAPLKGFMMYVLAGLVSLLHTLLLLLMRFVLKSKPPWRVVALAALPFVLVIAPAARGLGYPPINDISTDLGEPPQFDAAAKLPENKGRDMSFPPNFADIIRKTAAYSDIKPRVLTPGDWPSTATNPAEYVFDVVEERIRRYANRPLLRSDKAAGIIEGTCETSLFRFRDDFVIRVRANGENVVVDMRSKSRDGKGDLGTNAKRIRQFILQGPLIKP